jgi:HSP20 family molecular chaperone IbpA
MKNYKSFFSSKIFIAVSFTLIGATTAVLAHNIKERKLSSTSKFEDFDKVISEHRKKMLENFDNNSIFAEIEAIDKKMEEIFKAHHKHIRDSFEKDSKYSENSNKTAVFSHQDEKYYYYELSFSGFKKEDVSVEIKNNILTFSAKEKEENKEKKQYLAANFFYSFSLPQYDNKHQPEIIREDKKIIVKLKN